MNREEKIRKSQEVFCIVSTDSSNHTESPNVSQPVLTVESQSRSQGHERSDPKSDQFKEPSKKQVTILKRHQPRVESIEVIPSTRASTIEEDEISSENDDSSTLSSESIDDFGDIFESTKPKIRNKKKKKSPILGEVSDLTLNDILEHSKRVGEINLARASLALGVPFFLFCIALGLLFERLQSCIPIFISFLIINISYVYSEINSSGKNTLRQKSQATKVPRFTIICLNKPVLHTFPMSYCTRNISQKCVRTDRRKRLS